MIVRMVSALIGQKSCWILTSLWYLKAEFHLVFYPQGKRNPARMGKH